MQPGSPHHSLGLKFGCISRMKPPVLELKKGVLEPPINSPHIYTRSSAKVVQWNLPLTDTSNSGHLKR